MVSDNEILSTFDDIPGPFVTAGEISEHVPIGRKAISKRLNQMHEEGLVERKQPVSHMVGWWMSHKQQASD